MKKLGYVLMMYLLCTFNAFGQKQLDVKQYYEKVNKAELLLIDEYWNDAIVCYSQAFDVGMVIPVDAYNAFRVACLQRDTLNALKFFEKLVQVGQDLKYLNKNSFKKAAYFNDDFFDFVTKDYDTLRAYYQPKQMLALNEALGKVLAIDQSCRNALNDNVSAEEKARVLSRCDSLAYEALHSFIFQYGFPSYILIGLREPDYKTVMIFSTIDILMVHNRGNADFPIFELVHKAVKNGDYDAR